MWVALGILLGFLIGVLFGSIVQWIADLPKNYR
jgi:hypothetical protein